MKLRTRARLAWDILSNKRSWSPLDDRYYVSWMSGPTKAGVSIDEQTSLQVIAVYACVNLLASTIASLPLPVYRRLPRGKEKAVNHSLYSTLHDRPNDEQSSFIWRQTSMAHCLLWGNLYSEIEFNKFGRPVALWPLPPWRVKPRRTLDRQLFWEVRLPNIVQEEWNKTGKIQYIPDYAMYRVSALGINGITGLSPIQQAMEAVGLTMAAQEFGARLFGQGANMGGIVEHPNTISKEAHDNLEKSLNENYAGLGKAHRIMLLEEGMKWHQQGIQPDQAQFLETRKFQKSEIATLFLIPPHMIGHTEKTTSWGTGIEQQTLGFLKFTLRPWLINIEQETNYKLLKNDGEYFAEHMVEGLLRGDSKARAAFYKEMFMMGTYSPNKILEKENENPIPGGDETYIPLNMIPTSTAGNAPNESGPNDNSRLLRSAGGKRSALHRARVAKSYERLFKGAAEKIVDREKSNLIRAVNKHLGERSYETFQDWLEDFYRDFPGYINRQIEPIVQGLAEAIQPLAAEEINGDTKMTPELEKFLDEYKAAFAARYVKSSKGQIRAIMDEAAQQGTDIVEDINNRLNEWELKRPAKISLNETVQLSNAVAKTVFAAGGITRLIWQAVGSENCPFCEEMDGKVVGIEQEFLSKDDKLEAEGKSDMQVYRPTTQPPLHQGCVCQIGAA